MEHAPPWWIEEDNPALSPVWRAIMAEVEEAFSETGAGTPAWEDPHQALDDPDESPEEWYSRITAPERYLILWARVQAWENVIMAHGWALRSEVGVDELTWADAKPTTTRPIVVFDPVRTGGGRLVLARTGDPTSEIPPGIVVGTGDPMVIPSGLVPDCGCDACDTGSADLLEEVDRAIIPILDGSYAAGVRISARRAESWERTPFTAGTSTSHRRSPRSARLEVSTSAGPWFEDWTPMPLLETL
jgi:hypothetical protein